MERGRIAGGANFGFCVLFDYHVFTIYGAKSVLHRKLKSKQTRRRQLQYVRRVNCFTAVIMEPSGHYCYPESILEDSHSLAFLTY